MVSQAGFSAGNTAWIVSKAAEKVPGSRQIRPGSRQHSGAVAAVGPGGMDLNCLVFKFCRGNKGTLDDNFLVLKTPFWLSRFSPGKSDTILDELDVIQGELSRSRSGVSH